MAVLHRKTVEGLLILRLDHTALIFEYKMMTSDDDLFPANRTGDPMGHQILNLGMHLFMGKSALFCRLYHRIGHGMREMLLQAGCQTQHVRFLVAAEGHDLRNLWLGTRQRTGLVKDDRVGFRHSLKESATLNGQMMIARLFHRREHGDRHG